MEIKIPERPGKCRWCGCTYDDPCASGCGWANRAQTLCTACGTLDGVIRSTRGRQRLALAVQGELSVEDL